MNQTKFNFQPLLESILEKAKAAIAAPPNLPSAQIAATLEQIGPPSAAVAAPAEDNAA